MFRFNNQIFTLPETNSLPLKIGRAPRRQLIHLPTRFDSQGRAGSFKEGSLSIRMEHPEPRPETPL